MATTVRFSTALRTVLGSRRNSFLATAATRTQQRRWAQVHDVRFLATTQASRNVVEKYREKLDRKAREEGLRDVDELKAAYADRIQDLKKKDSASMPGLDALLADAEPQPINSEAHTPSKTSSNSPTPSSRASSSSTIKPLSAILDLPKARALPIKELSAVWRLRHASSSNSLCAVIPTATYRALEATARRYPTFVLPVPRNDAGAEIHFLQWVFDPESRTATVLFTQLAEFKARGEWAQPHTSITHYADYGEGGAESGTGALSDERNQGVVLMAGNLVEGRGASIQDARWLVMLMQRFYGAEGKGGEADDSAKKKLLEEFARRDGKFSVEKLLEESERLA